MLRDITIGKFYDAESLVHKLDPRTKLAGVLVYIVSLFLVKESWEYLVGLVALLALYNLAKVPLSYLLKGLKAIILLLVFTFVFRLFMTPGSRLVALGIFSITVEGLVSAIRMTARIALMIAMASLLSYTTTPKQMADGLEKAFSFLERFKVPVHEMSVIVMIAFRFIPLMLEELNVLMRAQMARGAKFEEGNLVERCKSVMTLLFPLFLTTVQRSSDLAMAMEARGYTGAGPTSRMYPLEYTAADRMAYVAICCYLLLHFALFIIL